MGSISGLLKGSARTKGRLSKEVGDSQLCGQGLANEEREALRWCEGRGDEWIEESENIVRRGVTCHMDNIQY